METPAHTPPVWPVQEAIPLAFGDAIPPGVRRKGALSPKRPAVEKAGLADIFPYYAGFSFEWACAQLAKHDGTGEITVLDPWNGSGTTSLAAQHLGHRALGSDLNPVANIIATLRAHTVASEVDIVPPRRRRYKEAQSDPLSAWFAPETVGRIRDWYFLSRSLAPSKRDLITIALFRSIRAFSKSFEGSNPTWVKRAKDSEDLVRISPREFDAALMDEVDFISTRLESAPPPRHSAAIITANSANLPLLDGSIDVVLTSPPYLTRIDYAVAYARELALLGVDISRDRTLRSDLMGTTLIRKSATPPREEPGEVASDLLSKIKDHDSKASSGYYLKQAQQYLQDLTAGLDEITRVCKARAEVHLVVQDSFYKDIHVPLADICIDEANARGWNLKERERFPVRRTLTSLNTSAQAYTKGNVEESVITFMRG